MATWLAVLFGRRRSIGAILNGWLLEVLVQVSDLDGPELMLSLVFGYECGVVLNLPPEQMSSYDETK